MQRKRKPLSQLSLDEQIVREKRPKGAEDEDQASSSSSSGRPTHTRAGTVSHMVLKNFMCHSHLEVVFDNNINYVIGRNGSGKSAILTALVVGLGGKASLTNRGNSIKSFIKAGKNGATVEITLRNHGPMAYRHNLFGNKIVVVRQFTASGSGSYKIKSAAGEVVSTQAKEVQRICSSLNIQVDNPICLLNQDTSRNFLNSKDPHQKFNLFMRATRLETLYEEYRRISANKRNAERLYKEKERLYQELKEELKVLKRKVENQKSVMNLKNKVTLLQRELLWAKVRDAEDDMQKQEEEVQQVENEKATMEDQMTSETRKQSTIEQTIQNLQRQVAALEGSVEEQNQPQNALVRSLGKLKEDLNEKRREKRIVLKDIAFKTGNCNILEQEIAKVTENFTQMEQEKLKRSEELAELEEKMKGVENVLETATNDQFQMRNSLNRLREEEYSLQSELRQIDAQIENTNSRIRSFQGANSNVLSLYGRDMPKIVEAINAVKDKFKHLPRGPLGSYITLKDKKWAVAVEGYINPGMLRAFVVDNSQDSRLLMSIFNRLCTNNKPMVITSKFIFKDHDVNNYIIQPIDGCCSIYSMLEVSDPVVRNCLVDQLSIESILLIPDSEKAMELMSDKRRVPKNCRQGVVVTGDNYYPDPNYKTYASRYHHAQYLQVSTADMIRQLEQKLAQLRDNKTSVSNQHKSVKAEVQEQSEKIKELEAKVIKLNRAKLHMKRQHEELKSMADPEIANVHTLENELAELKHLLEQRKAVNQTIEHDCEELKTKIADIEEQLERLKTIVRGYEDRIEPLQQQIREHVTKRKDFDVNKRFAAKRLDQVKNRIKGAQGELLQKRTQVERYVQEASTVGERLEELRQVAVIMEELNTSQRTIRQIEAEVESPEETSQKYTKCNERYKQATDLMKTMWDDVKEFRTAANKRGHYYTCTENYFITSINDSFESVLKVRQFKGNITINVKEKKLDLIVIPQQGSQGYTTTSNLSGGERSFSTVAFLYSLWQCMEFPFYFLDEFDVFMDKVNRSIVMDILKDHAKKNPDLQFVFLTPQDVTGMLNDKAVAIHRLEDPERAIVNGD